MGDENEALRARVTELEEKVDVMGHDQARLEDRMAAAEQRLAELADYGRKHWDLKLGGPANLKE